MATNASFSRYYRSGMSSNEFYTQTDAAGIPRNLAEEYYGVRSSSERSTSSSGKGKLNFAESITESVKATLGAQESKSSISELMDQDRVSYKDYLDAVKGGMNSLKMLEVFGGDILQQIRNEEQLRTDINETIGVTKSLSEQVRNTIVESTTGALKFGFGMKNISDMFTTIAETTGRANFMSGETVEKTYGVARAFVGSLTEVGKIIGEMEKIGLGASDSITALEKAGRSSLGLGLNTKKTTELLKGDLSKINEYGFKNGIEGLNRMVQKSIEFRMNLGEVYKIADKVMNPDSAIELTANLQVLGGAIGDFNDPLKLMYMATNNVEGLQDALIGAAGGLATYNKEQGRFEITGVNLRRAKEMAAQLGIEYKEFAKGAIAVQERLSVVQDLAGNGFDLSEKDQEFISNLSQMKDGRMVLSIPKDVADKLSLPVETAITDLTQNQIETLKQNRKDLEKMDSEEIAREQFSVIKNLDNNVNSLANRQIRGLSGQLKDKINNASLTEELQKIAEDAAKAASKDKTNPTAFDEYLNLAGEQVRNLTRSIGAEYLGNQSMEFVKQQMLQKIDENKKLEYNETRKKQELKTRPKEETSYNPNTILKSQIKISYPHGFGIPTAEQQGSYLVTV
jgi:hypothetical protein